MAACAQLWSNTYSPAQAAALLAWLLAVRVVRQDVMGAITRAQAVCCWTACKEVQPDRALMSVQRWHSAVKWQVRFLATSDSPKSLQDTMQKEQMTVTAPWYLESESSSTWDSSQAPAACCCPVVLHAAAASPHQLPVCHPQPASADSKWLRSWSSILIVKCHVMLLAHCSQSNPGALR